MPPTILLGGGGRLPPLLPLFRRLWVVAVGKIYLQHWFGIVLVRRP